MREGEEGGRRERREEERRKGGREKRRRRLWYSDPTGQYLATSSLLKMRREMRKEE
jgi:hypothetical protein